MIKKRTHQPLHDSFVSSHHLQLRRKKEERRWRSDDGLLKSKFQTKCRSLTKLTKTRLEMIKKKISAMQKYLKNDIADLLQNGLDSNAYSRAEGFLGEMKLSSCYEYVELACSCIATHLTALSKNRECPEDCREAVSSLMFAAARFGDFPELCELRNLSRCLIQKIRSYSCRKI